MTKTREPRETFPVDAAYLTAFAKRLDYIARRYKEIAQVLGSESIAVTGKPTAERSEGLLRGWMATLQAAADETAINAESIAADAEGDETAEDGIRKTLPRKKKR